MERSWLIRRAIPADLETVVALLQQLYDEIEHEVPPDLAVAVAASLLADEAAFIALLAIDPENGKAVGALTALESAAIYAGGAIGVISEFFVRPEARSGGVGRALVDEISRIGVARQWRRLEVTAPPDEERNQRAVAFYRANGFETSGPHLKLNLAR